MSMKILQYQGLGPVSQAIEFQTRSKYSHTAVQFSDGVICEAWHTGGKRFWHGSVRMISDPWEGHDPDTPVDVFRVEGYVNEEVAREFAEAQKGKRYDFWSVARFVSRRDAPANDRWFCSELGLAIFAAGELDLLHINPAHAAPGHVTTSPLTFYEKSI